jgi:hypothetical protein
MIANFATLGVVTLCWGALVVPGGFGLIAIALQVQNSHKLAPFRTPLLGRPETEQNESATLPYGIFWKMPC